MADGANAGHRFAIEPTWRARSFAFLRFVLFAALFIVANFAEHPALAPIHQHIKTSDGHFALEMSALGAITLLLTAILARFSGRTFGSYGLAGRHKASNFAIGLAAGIALLAVQLLIEYGLGAFSFGTGRSLDGTLLSDALLIGAMCVAVSFTEENLFRGYPLVEISRAIAFWPAVIVMSFLFGLPHWLKGGGEDLMGGAQAVLFGLALAYSFRATGSLWLAIGFHAGWDYAQSFIFGVPDSALVSQGRWLHPVVHGPIWLTGGAVGPEGSILTLIPLVLLFGIIRLAASRA